MKPVIRELDVRTLPPGQRHGEIFGIFDTLRPDEGFVIVNDHYPRPLLDEFQGARPGSCGLDRHIEVEEQILFPLFERMTGMTGAGPTFVMRSEHVDIRRLMGDTAAALEAADPARADASLDGLLDVLGSHNMKEERILYPMTDEAAGDDPARDDLVKRLQCF